MERTSYEDISGVRGLHEIIVVPIEKQRGEVSAIYKQGQRCKHCTTILRQSNPNNTCSPCIRKKALEILKYPDHSNIPEEEIWSLAFKKLKVKKRKQIMPAREIR